MSAAPARELDQVAPSHRPRTVAKVVGSLAALAIALNIAVVWGGTHPATAALVAADGVLAGAAGAVIGFGTAMTLPVLFALGIPPLVASMSTTVGLVPGSITAAVAFRPELAGQARRARQLGIAIALGSALGAAILTVLPAATFKLAAPVLILGSLLLVLEQPRIAARLEHRHPDRPAVTGIVAVLVIGVVGVCGGYYSGALGLVVLAALSMLQAGDLRDLNALKCVLVAVCNSVAAVEFLALTAAHHARLNWMVIALLAVGSIVGGLTGPWLSRRLSKVTLRVVIVVISVAGLAWTVHSW